MRSGRTSIAIFVGIFAASSYAGESRAVELSDYRTVDGYANNLLDPELGATFTPLLRKTPVAYMNRRYTPARTNLPSARVISNAVVAQNQSIPNSTPVTSFIWQWGQFIDHDIDLTPVAMPLEPFDILVPAGDQFFDPLGTGTATIELDRSAYDVVYGIRQQLNVITTYIDGSQVYGSDPERAAGLRTFEGGRLRTSEGNLLPFNGTEDITLPNAPDNSSAFFVAGDERANEQIDLTAMHTLFVREHNFWADFFALDTSLDDEEVYQLARAFVAAEIQKITYKDWLPIVLGPNALQPYRRYDPHVDPRVANVFSTAAFRFGHSMLPDMLLRLQSNGTPIPAGNLSLADAFFAPQLLSPDPEDLDSLLRGLAFQIPEEVDTMIVDGVRNFLFGEPGAGGFDLASLNIQRGRDHGLPDYNGVRRAYRLRPIAQFRNVTSNAWLAATLQCLYLTPSKMDPWVGLLAEDHVPGALVGPTIQAILADQFERLRDGDRYYYTRYLPAQLLAMVEQQTLGDIIRRNTGIGAELQANVFIAP